VGTVGIPEADTTGTNGRRLMRYAIYYCPQAGTGLATFGQAWLSRGTSIAGIDVQRFDALMRDVRRYGWHATIRAPFDLVPERGYDDLHRAVSSIANTMHAFALPLRLDSLAGFLALRPESASGRIDALAATCLHALHPLCAPLNEDLRRRRAHGLDATERELLRRYGYPYVLDRYRFHMTLAAPAAPHEERAMRTAICAQGMDSVIAHIDALAICGEAYDGADFEELERIPLTIKEAA
jgi:2'-5' RNA ligase